MQSAATCIIAVASERKPKIDAVSAVFRRLAPLLALEAESLVFEPASIPSGVEETPRSLEALTAGTRNRVMRLQQLYKERGRHPRYLVGLEGGLFTLETGGTKTTFLQSWVCISDGERMTFGASGALQMPETVADPVTVHGKSLAHVIDRHAGREGVRDNEGTFGVLTLDRTTRAQSFETALELALAPFYNRSAYESPGRGATITKH